MATIDKMKCGKHAGMASKDEGVRCWTVMVVLRRGGSVARGRLIWFSTSQGADSTVGGWLVWQRENIDHLHVWHLITNILK